MYPNQQNVQINAQREPLLTKFNFIQHDAQNVQLRETREPLLTWEPTEPATHPVDYVVPDFGQDGDVKDTLSHIG